MSVKKKRQWFTAIIALLLVVVMLAACGGGASGVDGNVDTIAPTQGEASGGAPADMSEANSSASDASVDVGFIQISTEPRNTMAISQDGTLWAWGGNEDWQLGTEDRRDRSVPTRVKDNVRFVLAEDSRTFAITNDNALWAWGSHAHPDGQSLEEKYKIMDNVAQFHSFAGEFAIDTSGRLWSWGIFNGGVLGTGTTEGSHEPVHILDNVASIYNFGSMFAITTNGELWGWGINDYNQLGLGDGAGDNQLVPAKIMDNVRSVHAPAGHSTVAVTNDNVLWGWGRNSHNQLIYSDIDNYSNPVEIMRDVSEVIGGHVIKTNGELWAWAPRWESNEPEKIMDNIKSLHNSAGLFFAIDYQDRLWAWGRETRSVIGTGRGMWEANPVHILDNINRLELVTTMDSHGFESSAFAITNNGELWAWGENDGHLATGDYETQLAPVKVLDNVADIFHSQGGGRLAPSVFVVTRDLQLLNWGGLSFNWSERNDSVVTRVNPTNVMSLSGSGEPTPLESDILGVWEVVETGGSRWTPTEVTFLSNGSIRHFFQGAEQVGMWLAHDGRLVIRLNYDWPINGTYVLSSDDNTTLTLQADDNTTLRFQRIE